MRTMTTALPRLNAFVLVMEMMSHFSEGACPNVFVLVMEMMFRFSEGAENK